MDVSPSLFLWHARSEFLLLITPWFSIQPAKSVVVLALSAKVQMQFLRKMLRETTVAMLASVAQK